MTSLLTGTKQMSNEIGYYIPVGSLIGQIYGRTEPSPAGGNTGTQGGSFSTASWAYWGNKNTSSINAAGAGVLRDMGRTVVSSLRTFRKVQLVVNSATASTFGVNGRQGTSPGEDYLTGYIELGFEGTGTPAPVAHFGR